MTLNPQITTQEIANELGMSRRAITKYITNLREKGLIRRDGPDKGGHWVVLKPEKKNKINTSRTKNKQALEALTEKPLVSNT